MELSFQTRFLSSLLELSFQIGLQESDVIVIPNWFPEESLGVVTANWKSIGVVIPNWLVRNLFGSSFRIGFLKNLLELLFQV